MRVSLGVVVPIAVATGLITVFLLSCIVRAHRHQVQTGGEALVDQTAVARGKFVPDSQGFRGQVFVHGEIWQARSASPVGEGQAVHICARDGLTLEVDHNGSAAAPEAERA
jgi:membrane-bound serine protease (ClpP class)